MDISITELSVDILLFVIGKLNLAGPYAVRSSVILANCCKVLYFLINLIYVKQMCLYMCFRGHICICLRVYVCALFVQVISPLLRSWFGIILSIYLFVVFRVLFCSSVFSGHLSTRYYFVS